MTTTETPDALLRLARKLAAEQSHIPGVAGLILEGSWDRTPEIQCALAAIRETTRLAAAWIESEQPGYIERCDDPAMAAAYHYAGGLEDFAHLKHQENE